MSRIIFFVVLGVLLTPVTVLAAQAADDEVPMEITSDTMRYDQNQSYVVFEGDVHAVREDMDIRATTVTVHLKETQSASASATGAGEIEKIVAEGNVRITQGDRKGTSSKATYYADQGLLVMEGDPVLTEGKNRIEGRLVRLYLRENRSEIEGGGDKRVEALFFTPKSVQEEEKKGEE